MKEIKRNEMSIEDLIDTLMEEEKKKYRHT